LRARRYHILVLLLPHKRHTFDYCHPVTALAHLVDDFKAEMGEDDLTHLPEILVLRDLERDPDGGDMASFKARSLRNVENRCLHHHVFDTRLADDLLSHASFKVWAVEEIAPHHILHPRGNRRRPGIDYGKARYFLAKNLPDLRIAATNPSRRMALTNSYRSVTKNDEGGMALATRAWIVMNRR
jgi:hypothetical protein